MSDTDSFIDEVTEEVRQERLWLLARRYGWIVILAVVLLVGGAAWNEFRKARETATRQAAGDSIITALESEDDAARLEALSAARLGDAAGAGVVISFYEAAEAAKAGETARAAEILGVIAADEALPRVYRDLAVLKSVLAGGGDVAARRAALEGIANPGAPFRLMAEEQLAVLDVAEGNTDAAITRLQTIITDQEASQGLRNRVRQLIVALGGSLDAG